MGSFVDEKRALRRAMGERREVLSAEERLRRTLAAGANLQGLGELAGARVIAVYAAKGAELEPMAALAPRVFEAVLYPRVTGGSPRLRFHRVARRDELRPGPFGVHEPEAVAPEVPAEAIDLFVVPGLAFDAGGRRVGYGGGYYDELIAHVRRRGRGFFVGLGFDFQLVDRCPAGEGDEAVDCVVTDARVVRREAS